MNAMKKNLVITIISLLVSIECFAGSAKLGTSAQLGRSSLNVGNGVSISGMTVTPANQSIQNGGNIGYTATIQLSNGNNYDATPFVSWSSSNNSIAQPTGLTTVELYTCNSVGSIQVTAAFGSLISASTGLTCTAPPPPPTLVSITLSPVNPSCSVGQTQGFNAVGLYSDGSSQDITATASWSSTDNTIANPTGLVGGKESYSCLKGGSVTVTATLSSISGTTGLTSNAVLVSIAVAPTAASILVGAQQQFSATCNYNDGSTQNCSGVTWNSSSPSIATINSSGQATGVAQGTSNITAVIGSITSNTAVLTVTNQGPPPPTLTSITVTPANQTINVGATLAYTATCNYSDGSTQNCTSFVGMAWNSTNTGTATISASGVATGVAAGTTTIQATYQSITGSTGLTVQVPAPTLVSIAVTPATPQVYVNSSIGFTATGTYSDGSKKDVTLSASWTTSNKGVATLSAPTDPQNANCASAGTSTIGAAIGSIAGSTVLTCVNNAPPSFGNDAYCPSPSHTCNFGGTDHTATLPRTGWYTDPSTYPGAGTVRTVTDAASWTSAWAAAVCGDVIQQTAGTSIQDPSTPPVKSCASNPIIYRTSGFANLPAYGQKITPCFAGVSSLPGRPAYPCPANPVNYMAKITTSKPTGPFNLTSGTAGIVVEGIEITRNAGTKLVTNLTNVGGSNHILFEHIWCHGDETGDETNNCVNTNNSTFQAMEDSFANDFYCISVTGSCTDAHVIGGGTNNAAGCTDNTFKFVNNFAEASGENAFQGGGAAQCTPTDFEIRNNWFFKPLTWNPSCTAASPCNGFVYNGGFGGNAVEVKNLQEFKNIAYVLAEGNRYDNTWGGFSQPGEAISLTPKNQAGPNGTNLCPLCEVHDVTIRYSSGSFMQQAFQISNAPSDNGGYAQGGFDYSLHDIVFDNIDPVGMNGGSSSTSLMEFSESVVVPSNDILHHVYMDHITLVPANPQGVQNYALLGMSGALPSTGNMMHDNTITNMVGPLLHGAHPSAGAGQADCAVNQTNATGILTNCNNPLTFGGNMWVDIVGGQQGQISWPGTNCLTQTNFANVFVNYNNGIGGDYTLSGPCKGTGTDGKDPGADIPTVNARTQIATQFGSPSGNPSPNANWAIAFANPSGCVSIQAFWIRASNNEFYLACRDGAFWESFDHVNWSNITGNITFGTNGIPWSIQVNPNDGCVIASTGGNPVKFWRLCTDASPWTWTQITAASYHDAGGGSDFGCALPLASGANNLVCGGYFGSTGTSAFYSSNGGATAQLVTSYVGGTTGSVLGLATNPVDTCEYMGTETQGIFKSCDGGKTFTNILTTCPSPCSGTYGDNYGITFDTAGDVIMDGNGGVWKGVGSGNTYTFTNTFHTNQGRGLFTDSLGSIYYGHLNSTQWPKSMYRSLDSGATFQAWDTGISNGLSVVYIQENHNDGKIYAVVVNPSSPFAASVYSTPK